MASIAPVLFASTRAELPSWGGPLDAVIALTLVAFLPRKLPS